MSTISDMFVEQEDDMRRLNEIYCRLNERHEKMRGLMKKEETTTYTPRDESKKCLRIDCDVSSTPPLPKELYVGAREAGMGREQLVRQIQERERREKRLETVPISIPCSDATSLRYSPPRQKDMQRQIRSTSSPKVKLASPRANGRKYEADDELKMHKFRFKSPRKPPSPSRRRRTLPHLRSDRQLVCSDKKDKVHDGVVTEAEEKWIETLHISNKLTRRQSKAFSYVHNIFCSILFNIHTHTKPTDTPQNHMKLIII